MNTLKTAFFIAFKSIVKGHKSTLVLLIFILSLSFLNMMFISGILTGLQATFTDIIVDVWSSHITVGPQEEPQRRQYIEDQDRVRAQIETIPGIIATSRHYQLAGSISYDKEKNGVYTNVSGAIIAIDPEQEKKSSWHK
jgi:putative ABC transport system permease protein